jgi:hypothetical protein
MNPIDRAGWYIVGVIVVGIIGAILEKYLGKAPCSSCEVVGLKAEISFLKNEVVSEIEKHRKEVAKLCLLVRALAQRAGMTVREQAELESLEAKS